MWKTVSQILADQFGAYYAIKSQRAITTEETHQTWIIDDGIQPVFVKVCDKNYRSMLRAQADQLQLLSKTHCIQTPQVYGVGCSQHHSFLLLEALELKPLAPSKMAEFGKQLAKLHQWQPQKQYGLEFDTWLGKVHQPNEWQTNWSTFFSQQRIGWQLQLCNEKGIHFGDMDQITQAIATQLAKHQPQPALLHGNLWHKTCGQSHHQVFVYNPACYWGDRECDIAFTELFEPFPSAFYQGYQEVYPLEKGYLQRKPIYQLYYLLNFSHRYQGDYIEKAQQIIDLFR